MDFSLQNVTYILFFFFLNFLKLELIAYRAIYGWVATEYWTMLKPSLSGIRPLFLSFASANDWFVYSKHSNLSSSSFFFNLIFTVLSMLVLHNWLVCVQNMMDSNNGNCGLIDFSPSCSSTQCYVKKIALSGFSFGNNYIT